MRSAHLDEASGLRVLEEGWERRPDPVGWVGGRQSGPPPLIALLKAVSAAQSQCYRDYKSEASLAWHRGWQGRRKPWKG